MDDFKINTGKTARKPVRTATRQRNRFNKNVAIAGSAIGFLFSVCLAIFCIEIANNENFGNSDKDDMTITETKKNYVYDSQERSLWEKFKESRYEAELCIKLEDWEDGKEYCLDAIFVLDAIKESYPDSKSSYSPHYPIDVARGIIEGSLRLCDTKIKYGKR